MKMIFATDKDEKKGIIVTDSCGNQYVIGVIQDGIDLIVLIVDQLKFSYYIERVSDQTASDMFASANFETLDNEEWITYYDFFKNNGVIPDGF